MTTFGVPAVVAINAFPTDTPAEVEAIREVALAAGAREAVVATHFTDGGAGADGPRRGGLGRDRGGRAGLQLLYPDEMPLAEKIETIVDAGSTAPRASSTCPAAAQAARRSTRSSASASCRSAWPRRSTR